MHTTRKTLEAITVNEALTDAGAEVEDTKCSAINGYRVVHRSGMELEPSAKQVYARTCSLLNNTLDYVFTVCNTRI